jgi:hypothetical protein
MLNEGWDVYLVEDPRDGAPRLVFAWRDPRNDGYSGNLTEGVSLDYDMEQVHRWPDGDPQPEAVVGRAPTDAKHYKVFKYEADRKAAGYEPVAGTAKVVGSWSDYLLRHRPEDLPEEDWHEFLDRFDEASRKRPQAAPTPAGTGRDDVAAWLAKRHFIADTGIREVWYLPGGAPPDEIRLLELNDRFGNGRSDVEPIDFGLDVGGAKFHLLVADVSTDQLERIRQDPSSLPRGWTLDGTMVWRRRGA